jgi:enolase
MSAIVKTEARQVWDSRGRPTIEVEVTLASGVAGRAIAPSGASTGRREALDKRDGDTRLGGFGVNTAIAAVTEVMAPGLHGLDAADQTAVDAKLLALDGTPQKTNLGGNAIVATSLAVAWAAAADQHVPLWRHLADLSGVTPRIPLPMIQIFGGGRHAGNRIDVQDYLVIAQSAQNFAQACEMTAEVYFAAARDMAKRGKLNGIADEGGVWPDFSANEDGLEHLTRAIETAGFKPGVEVGIALDIAASSFFADGAYVLALEGKRLTTDQMIALLKGWVDTYPIVSLEDPLAEDDDAGFVAITRELGDRIQLIGDDYFSTDARRIARFAREGACNSALLKANQCGTVTELIAAAGATRDARWNAIQSGRSGESEDVSLSHLAIGLRSEQIKVGSITRSERTAKWNEVIRIEARESLEFWPFALPGKA